MTSAITVVYELHPPPDVSVPGLEPIKHHQFTIPTNNAQSGKEYYEALRTAVLEAKSTLGEELTAWRDAVGTREQMKEGKSPRRDKEEEDEEEEGEGEDQ